MNLKGKNVAVLGFGVEGKDLTRYLLQCGASVTVHDKKNKDELEPVDFVGLKLVCGEKYLDGLKDYDVIYRSPGIYRYTKEIIQAEKGGVVVSSATKLFFDECKGKIIGVTGTKGKGTTATLIHRSLTNNNKKAYLLGNIGEPFLDKLGEIKKHSWVVLELSSFQLIDLTKSPHIAVVLNITEDHLDWHKSIKEYVESKQNILKHQNDGDYAVISHDYETSRSFSELGKGKKYFFSLKNKVNGCFVDNGEIEIALRDFRKTVCSVDDLALKGSHILENATASACASYLAGVSLSSIRKAIVSFKGYEHRMEFVKNINKVSFYNDSAATGPHSVLAAVSSFDLPITLILGGFDKGLNYEDFVRDISQNKNVSNIVLIGDISGNLEKLFKNSSFSGQLINMGKKNMNKIVQKANELADRGGVVLLSPVSSSFDMFDNYRDRGNKFKEAVNNLKQ